MKKTKSISLNDPIKQWLPLLIEELEKTDDNYNKIQSNLKVQKYYEKIEQLECLKGVKTNDLTHALFFKKNSLFSHSSMALVELETKMLNFLKCRLKTEEIIIVSQGLLTSLKCLNKCEEDVAKINNKTMQNYIPSKILNLEHLERCFLMERKGHIKWRNNLIHTNIFVKSLYQEGLKRNIKIPNLALGDLSQILKRNLNFYQIYIAELLMRKDNTLNENILDMFNSFIGIDLDKEKKSLSTIDNNCSYLFSYIVVNNFSCYLDWSILCRRKTIFNSVNINYLIGFSKMYYENTKKEIEFENFSGNNKPFSIVIKNGYWYVNNNDIYKYLAKREFDLISNAENTHNFLTNLKEWINLVYKEYVCIDKKTNRYFENTVDGFIVDLDKVTEDKKKEFQQRFVEYMNYYCFKNKLSPLEYEKEMESKNINSLINSENLLPFKKPNAQKFKF
jgi:hypothetical protein